MISRTSLSYFIIALLVQISSQYDDGVSMLDEIIGGIKNIETKGNKDQFMSIVRSFFQDRSSYFCDN